MRSMQDNYGRGDDGVADVDEDALVDGSGGGGGENFAQRRRHSAHYKTQPEAPAMEIVGLAGAAPPHEGKSASASRLPRRLLPSIHLGGHKEDNSKDTTSDRLSKKKVGTLSRRERAAIAKQLRVTEEQQNQPPPPPPPAAAPSAKDKEAAKLHQRRTDPDYSYRHRRPHFARRPRNGEGSNASSAASLQLRRRLSAAASRVNVLPPPTQLLGAAARGVTLRRRRASQEGASASSSSSLSGPASRSPSSMYSSSFSSSSSTSSSAKPWEVALSIGSDSGEDDDDEKDGDEDDVSKGGEEDDDEDKAKEKEDSDAVASTDGSTSSLTPCGSFGWYDVLEGNAEKENKNDKNKPRAQSARGVPGVSAQRQAMLHSAPPTCNARSTASEDGALPWARRRAAAGLQSSNSNVSSSGKGSSGSLVSSNSRCNSYGSFLYGGGSANAMSVDESGSVVGMPQQPLVYGTRSSSSSGSSGSRNVAGLGSPHDSAASLSWLMYSARSNSSSSHNGSIYSNGSNRSSGSSHGSRTSHESTSGHTNGGVGSNRKSKRRTGEDGEEDRGAGSEKGHRRPQQQQQQQALNTVTTSASLPVISKAHTPGEAGSSKSSGGGGGAVSHAASSPACLSDERTTLPALKPHKEHITLPVLRTATLSRRASAAEAEGGGAEVTGHTTLRHGSASGAARPGSATQEASAQQQTQQQTPSHIGPRPLARPTPLSTVLDKLPDSLTPPNSTTSQRTWRRLNRRVSFIGEIR